MDRRPEDGAGHRERPFPAQELGARSPADARAQPALLGARTARISTGSSFASSWRARTLSIGSGMASSTLPTRSSRPRVPALRREPGVKVLAEPERRYQSFEFRIGPAGHPALKQARSPRPRLRHRSRRARPRGPGEINPNLRRSRACSSSPEPLLPAALEQLSLSTGARPSPARAGGLSARPRRHLLCAASGSSLRFVTVAGNPVRARILSSSSQAQLRRSGVEVSPPTIRPGAFFETILPSGDFDVALFGFFGRSESDRELRLRMRWQPELHRLLPAARDGDLDQADRILDAREQARVMNRADAQLARDCPLSRCSRFRSDRRQRRPSGTSSSPLNPLDELRELVARALARLARRASRTRAPSAGSRLRVVVGQPLEVLVERLRVDRLERSCDVAIQRSLARGCQGRERGFAHEAVSERALELRVAAAPRGRSRRGGARERFAVCLAATRSSTRDRERPPDRRRDLCEPARAVGWRSMRATRRFSSDGGRSSSDPTVTVHVRPRGSSAPSRNARASSSR